MLPAIAGALISGGASILGNLFNTGSVNKTNQQQADFNKQMYDRQRADALADFDKLNAYNSPSQQMQRFKEAGLNPNLIYGQMSNAPAVRSTDMKAPDFVAPRLDTSKVGSMVQDYYDIQQKGLQTKQQEAALGLLAEQTRGQKIQNDVAEAQMPESTQVTGLKNRNIQAQTDSAIESMNLTRLKRSLVGKEYEKLDQEVKTLVTNNKYLNQSLDTRNKIQSFMAEQVDLINKGLVSKNNIGQIEAKWKQQIDNMVGPGQGISESVIKILLTALTHK